VLENILLTLTGATETVTHHRYSQRITYDVVRRPMKRVHFELVLSLIAAIASSVAASCSLTASRYAFTHPSQVPQSDHRRHYAHDDRT
jgi:hypothetical protein